MFAPTAAPSNAARSPYRALRHLLRSGPIAAACCTSFWLAHAEDSAHIFANANADFDADTQSHALMAGAEHVAEAQPNDGLQNNAVAGQAADVGSAGVGLLLGAAESNPLGLVTMGLKAVAYQRIKESPPMEQPRLWGMCGALGWGAAIATGGAAAAVCPLIGLGAGMGSWSAGTEERDKATFALICRDLPGSQAQKPGSGLNLQRIEFLSRALALAAPEPLRQRA